jgi:hemolysin activation/secretion protein
MARFFLLLALCFPALPQVLAQGTAPVAANAPATPRFDLLEFDVLGNTVLPDQDIETVLYPFLGTNKAFEDLDNARAALEKHYQSLGFVTVSVEIPEQPVAGGIITLQVREGRIGRTSTKGANYFASSLILEQVTEVSEGNVLNVKRLQQQLALVNRGADIVVQPSLKPGRTPGTVDIELNVDDKLPVHGSASVSNYKTFNTTNTRLAAEIRYDNFLQRRHSLGFGFTLTPEKPDELRILTLTYILPFLDRSTGLLYFVDSDSNSVAAAGTLLVNGKFSVFGGRYLVPLPEADQWRATASFGFDHKRNVISTNLGGDNQPLFYTPLTIGLTAQRNVQGNLWRLDGSIIIHPKLLSAGDGVWASRRVLGSNPSVGINPEFAYLRFDVSNERPLAKTGLRLRSRIAGQFTNQPLVNLEQLALGGQDSSRAYFESEALADRGIRGGMEIQWPNLFQDQLKPYSTSFTALGFMEGGRIWTIDPLATQPASARMASVGLGMRIRAARQYSLAIDFARALVDGPITKSGDHRLTARAAFEF